MISLALNMNGLWLLTRLTGFKSTAGEVSCDLAWLRNTTYYFKLMLKHIVLAGKLINNPLVFTPTLLYVGRTLGKSNNVFQPFPLFKS